MKIIDVIKNAYRELNLIPVDGRITDLEQTEAMLVLESIWEGLFGTVIGVKLVDITLSKSDKKIGQDPPRSSRMMVNNVVPSNCRIIYNTSGDNSLYFQNEPSDGARMGFIRYHGMGDATLVGNGRLIDGMYIRKYNTDAQKIEWWYRAELGEWVERKWGNYEDELPFPDEYIDYFICGLARRLASRYNVQPSQAVTGTETFYYNEMRRRYYTSRQVMGSNKWSGKCGSL